uniref:Uncharacterized protein n=1 Tax=Timema douglasi TaxID=61478 RepID=A0A7R8VP19_TIMDO|nr:unnamed protein product [Timema douglasi]
MANKIQSTIKQNGMFHGIMYLLLLSMSAHLTKQLGMAPGGEFRRAFIEAKKVPSCLIHLGDRPIQITLKRALSSLSWWQTLRLTWHLLMCKEPVSKEEIERCKRRDLLEEMLSEMAGEFPALGTVFVNERDVYLTHSLQLAAAPVAMTASGRVVLCSVSLLTFNPSTTGLLVQVRTATSQGLGEPWPDPDLMGKGYQKRKQRQANSPPPQRYTASLSFRNVTPARVVGVVGIGHVPGIVQNWGKVSLADIPPIMRLPPPSLSGRIIKFTVKISVVGLVVWGLSKLVPLPSLESVKSGAQGLLQLRAPVGGVQGDLPIKTNDGETFVMLTNSQDTIGTSFINVDHVDCYPSDEHSRRMTDEYSHVSSNVHYVECNVAGPGCNTTDLDAQFSKGCDCLNGNCDSESDCPCVARYGKNYSGSLLLANKFNGPVVECNSECGCSKTEKCGNRVVQFGPHTDLEIFETPDGKGLGLKTKCEILTGKFICEYAGEIIGLEEAKRRSQNYKDQMNYIFVLNEHLANGSVVKTCVDPTSLGNIGRYINHSCRPNAAIVPVRVDCPVPKLCIFATRTISPCEEITFDYSGGEETPSTPLGRKPCHCHAQNCKGYLPFDQSLL